MRKVDSPALAGLGPEFLAAIEHNCAVADAFSATDFTLCVYLMKMREYFRWQQAIPYSDNLESEALGKWIRNTEAWWEEIEHESLRPVPLAGQQIDAFETAEINQHLLERKLVYSAGYGQRGKAHFFLGRLEDISERRHFQIIVSSDEYARDLVSPVAMTLDRTIFLRRQALQRLLWEKVQEISWNKAETALARSLQGWDFSGNPENALRQAAERFLSVFADHEIGEVMAGEHLGERWEDMLGSHLDSRLELQLRAVRDFLADHLSTLPHLLEEMDEQCLHFYFGMLSPIRKTVYPRLLAAYDRWRESADPEPLRQLVEERVSDWLIACEDILAAHESQSTGGQQRVADTLEQHLERINRD